MSVNSQHIDFLENAWMVRIRHSATWLLRRRRSGSARLDGRRVPAKSALQAMVGSVSAKTWERINWTRLGTAHSEGVEDGSQVRADSTVTETDSPCGGRRDSRLQRRWSAGGEVVGGYGRGTGDGAGGGADGAARVWRRDGAGRRRRSLAQFEPHADIVVRSGAAQSMGTR